MQLTDKQKQVMKEEAERLKDVLTTLNMTSIEFVRRMGDERGDTIYAYLNGKRAISRPFLGKIRAAYNINPEFIKSGRGEQFCEGGPRNPNTIKDQWSDCPHCKTKERRILDLEKMYEDCKRMYEGVIKSKDETIEALRLLVEKK